MSKITADKVKTIKEITDKVASGELLLDKASVGESCYDLLQRLFVQDEFVLTGCKVSKSDNSFITLTGVIDELLGREGDTVEVSIFDLKGIEDTEVVRHCLLKANIPQKAPNKDYVDYSGQDYAKIPDEAKEVETTVFFDDYRKKLNELSDEEAEQETMLDLYLSNNKFATRQYIFSSLPCSPGLDAIYPESFKAFCEATAIQKGINLKMQAKVDDEVVKFLNGVLNNTYKDLEKAAECHGVITEDNEKVSFLIRPSSVSASLAVTGDVSLDLDSINFVFVLETGSLPWPEVLFTGGLALFGDKYKASLRLDLYNGQLTAKLFDFPTLGKILNKIDGFKELFENTVVEELLAVSLTEMTAVIELDPKGAKGVTLFTMRLDYEKDINLLEDVISFKPCLEIKVRNPISPDNIIIEGMLGGTWKLGDNEFLTAVHYPSREVTVSLKEDTFIDTKELMTSLFPAGNFPKVDIDEIKINGSLRTGAFSFELGATVKESIDICGQPTALKKAQISITRNNTEVEEATIYSEIDLMGVPTEVTIQWTATDGLELTAMTPEDEDISVKNLFNKFLGIVGLPGGIRDFSVSNLQLYAAPKGKTYSFSGEAEMDLMPELQLEDIEFSVTRWPLEQKEKDEEEDDEDDVVALGADTVSVNDGSFSTRIVLGGVAINLAISVEHDEDGNPAKEFKGSTKGLDVSLTSVLKSLLTILFPRYAEELSDILPQMNLKDIYITYENTSKEFNLVAVGTAAGGKVKFFFQNRSKNTVEGKEIKPRFAFGIKADAGDLSGLPMVGDSLKDAKATDLGFVYTSYGDKAAKDADAYGTEDAIFTLPDIKTVAGKTSIKQGEKRKYKRGTSITGKIKLPGEASALEMELETSEKVKPKTVENTPQLVSVDMEVYDLQGDKKEPASKFFKVGKKIGPVTIKEIGLSYRDGTIGFLISGHVEVSGLKLSLDGLGIHFVMSELFSGDVKPAPGLTGLGLVYKNAPIEIEGAFKRGIQDGEDVYNGGALIKASKFSISAIGSYATVKGQASLFIYGLYEGAIGGPAFFFVTGIAAGFGYNRRVQIPSIDKVRTFPLVALAMKPDPDKKLKDILDELATKNAIMISAGDYWLAAGVKFTSFKIIDSFVLLIVQFGSSLEFTILGLSVLAWPDKKNPIAYVELALLARFGPASDVIAVQAALTNNSWVLDKNCRITGGFAFYAWVSGPHEGDFVVTLGGYHPKFIKPAHYPSVDRLELNWKIDDALSIRGQMYYALTPSAIMAGGRWEVEYNLSFLRATITLWADMVISWAPYFYRIDAGIRVRIEARIKVLFVRVYFALEIGAEVHIWGPSFAGEIFVDWSIFSFTIPFGKGERKDPDKIGWEGFSGSFIPAKKPDAQKPVRGAEPKKDEVNTLDSRVTAGISRKENINGTEVIIVNPGDLELSIDSFAPLTDIYTGKKSSGLTSGYTDVKAIKANVHVEINSNIIPLSYGSYKARNLNLGIRPMGISSLKSSLTFSLTQPDGSMCDMELTGTTKGVADALWGSGPLVNDMPDAKVLPDVLTGMKLTAPKRTDYAKEKIKRTKDDFTLIQNTKDVVCLSNGASKTVDKDVAADKIKKGLKDTKKRVSIAEELLLAGLTINVSELDKLPDTELRFRQTPNLISLATNMTGDDQ